MLIEFALLILPIVYDRIEHARSMSYISKLDGAVFETVDDPKLGSSHRRIMTIPKTTLFIFGQDHDFRLILERLSFLKELRSLELGDTNIRDNDCDALASLSFIECLSLEKTSISDQGLAKLSKHKKLKILNLDDTEFVTDHGLQLLSQIESLQEISLSRTAISDEGLAKLSNFKTLRKLNLDSTSITDRGIAHLSQLDDLEELSLDGTPISDIGLSKLRKLRKLRVLRLNNTLITDQGLAYLAYFEQLHVLSLDNTSISDDGIKHLKHLTNLESLFLGDTKVHGRGLSSLSRLDRLYHLDLRKSEKKTDGKTGIDIRAVTSFKSLGVLDLSGCGVNDDMVEIICTITSLEQLSLNNNPVSDLSIHKLAELRCLTVLKLFSTNVTPKGKTAIQAVNSHIVVLGVFEDPGADL